MSGLIGKKIGMTSVFDGHGRNIPVTVIEVPAAVITQIKTVETDGYNAVQIASFERKDKNISKPVLGHLKKAGTSGKAVVMELRDYLPEGLVVGDELSVDAVLSVGDTIDVAGTSKGHGFTGVIKRHNFHGASESTHGQQSVLRSPGSIGGASDPSRVFKGKKMAGQSGNERVKIKNLIVAKIISESNLVLVTGAIPGPNGGYVELLTKPSLY